MNDTSALLRNEAGVRGGGAFNVGTMTMSDSSAVRRNRASGDGAGICNGGTFAMIDAATIVRNVSDAGVGGLYMFLESTTSGHVCAPASGANVRENTPVNCGP